MKGRGIYVGLAIILFGLVLQGISQLAYFYQWGVDRAYVKGRTMERLCAKDAYKPVMCERHNQDTGHTALATPD